MERSAAPSRSVTARSVWLSGFMGSGKTTVGRAVAARLAVPFVDLDETLERETGRTIAQWFEEDGEAAFRAREAQIAMRLLAQTDRQVVAAGGGTLVDARVRARAMESALVVTLHVRIREALERIGTGRHRPLAAGGDGQLAELLRARQGVYAIAHAGVRSGGRPIEAVVDDLVHYAAGVAVPVSLGPRSYPVHVERGTLGSIGRRVAGWSPRGPVAVISDRGVPREIRTTVLRSLRRAGLTPISMPVAPGERSKSLKAATRLWNRILGAGLGRPDPVVAVGGGVATDLAGFVAATALRGMPIFHVPTTVLGQLDAAIGGKTAVDHASGKNRIGAFHAPRLVLADPDVLASLSDRDRIAGLAEAVKCGLALDAALLETCTARAAALRAGDPDALEAVIRGAAAVKAQVVSDDEREEDDGIGPGRVVLNLGHTVGHALEAAGGFERWLHGEAVALGLVAAARLSVALVGAPRDLPAQVGGVLAALGLPVDLGPLDERTAAFLPADKKAAGDRVRLVLLKGVGVPVLMEVAVADVVRILS